MEDKKQIVTLPLIARQESYFKMVIPEEVERKIRLLCREIHNIEWSGILFYEASGSFENKDLVVTCVDIYQMDIGNSTYTEYTMNPSVATYMLEHDLMNAYQGHIHSHNNMSTFFSGTDTQELRDGGKDTNHFVSLIVNNKGPYTAGITRRVTSKSTISEEYSYNSFNDVEYVGSREYVTENTYLEWFKLQIEVEGGVRQYEQEMLDRIKEIRAEKNKTTSQFNNKSYTWPNSNYNLSKYPAYNKENKAETSFITTAGKGNYTQKELPFEDELDNIPYGKKSIDKNLIMSVTKQLITCSAIIPNNSTIDIEKWGKAIPKLYTERFGNTKIFKEFAEPYVDFLLNYIDESVFPEDMDLTETVCVLAYEVQKELIKLPENEWIKTYIEILDDYIL